MKVFIILFSVIVMNINLMAQEKDIQSRGPEIIDMDIKVGAALVNQESDNSIGATLEFDLKNNFIPFRVELWFGDIVPNLTQMRNLKAAIGQTVLNESFALLGLAVEHEKIGIGDQLSELTGISPVLVNYSYEILPDNKLLFKGEIGLGGALGPAKALPSEIALSKKESVGFYLPVGASLYGQTKYFDWLIESSHKNANSKQTLLLNDGDRSKTLKSHHVRMQTFKLSAEADLKLEKVLTSKLVKGSSAFLRLNYSHASLVDDFETYSLSKNGHTILNQGTSHLRNTDSFSGEVGIKINFNKKIPSKINTQVLGNNF